MAARATQAGRGPRVDDFDLSGREAEGTDLWAAVAGTPLNLSIQHPARPHHPVRVLNAASLRPAPGQAISAVHGDRGALGQPGAGGDELRGGMEDRRRRVVCKPAY